MKNKMDLNKRGRDYTEKELKSLRKCDLRTLIHRNTVKEPSGLYIMTREELVNYVKLFIIK